MTKQQFLSKIRSIVNDALACGVSRDCVQVPIMKVQREYIESLEKELEKTQNALGLSCETIERIAKLGGAIKRMGVKATAVECLKEYYMNGCKD